MKFAIVTSDGHEHRYVLERLAATLDDRLRLVIIEKWPKRKAGLAALKSLTNRYSPVEIAERIVSKAGRIALRHGARRQAGLAHVLGAPCAMPTGIPIHTTPSANHPDCVDRLRALAPDYILVYGTGIIKAPLIASATRATLNLHTGISPYYRGSDCEFWPLYDGAPARVGATVHLCTADVDGGAIFRTVAAPLASGDTVFTAFGHSVKAGAAIYADIAADLAAGAELMPLAQDFALGREFRFKDRTLFHDLVMEARTLTGALSRAIAAGT